MINAGMSQTCNIAEPSTRPLHRQMEYSLAEYGGVSRRCHCGSGMLRLFPLSSLA